jgi:hypothetical protein
MKKNTLYILLIISQLGFSQSKNSYAGHFIDRDGRTDLIIKDNGSNFEVDVTKDGAYRSGLAKQEAGILYGFFLEGKDSVGFNIVFQEKELILTANSFHLILNKADDFEYEAPTSYEYPTKKIAVNVPYPNGNRIFNSTGTYAFTTPDPEWEATEDDGIFILKKEQFRGFLKIIPHEIPTIVSARNQFNINDLYPGKYEIKSFEKEYGQRGVFRSFTGYDNENRMMKFHVLTLVSLEGKGVHIICGSHSNDFKKEFEIYTKMIANSFEFTN